MHWPERVFNLACPELMLCAIVTDSFPFSTANTPSRPTWRFLTFPLSSCMCDDHHKMTAD